MSNETKDFYNYQFASSFSLCEIMNLPTSASSSYGNNVFDPSSYSSTDCLQISPGAYQSLLQKIFGISPTSSEVFNSSIGETPTRVSAPSSYSEANHPGEDSSTSRRKRKLAEDGGEENQSSKKVFRGKAKKNEEKKQREPRVSVMVKSQAGHIVDGYRWRIYGRKAVKTSPYPRSYYRCTTQRCNVKKRVEKAVEDPTIFITTYEGRHNHPSDSV
ncbi:putative WRKY transcription factor 28 [Raphanus sativus]|nr:putative WRKY transcription factor 28 [Raphanus sativus]KAJ4899884.1 putative WRKY transcription factor 28 [Raphanus sativus]